MVAYQFLVGFLFKSRLDQSLKKFMAVNININFNGVGSPTV